MQIRSKDKSERKRETWFDDIDCFLLKTLFKFCEKLQNKIILLRNSQELFNISII
jgi:hypothetical protein